jgi:23S rRNA pseudouridine2605 synthase
MSKKGFDKFINKEPKGSAKKEAIRQEKRKAKKEARALGEAMRQKKWDKKHGIVTDEDLKPKPSKFTATKGNKILPNGKRQDGRLAKGEAKKSFGDTKPYKTFDNNSTATGKKIVVTKTGTPTSQETPSKNLSIKTAAASQIMPLNKFVAHAGVCGRREAAELVKQGLVTVNGDKVFEPGFKVSDKDEVLVKGKKLFLQHNLVYILVNKPKDYITTANDPEGRKTIFDLLKNATPERIYPVGRLDRNTTGVLLMTNDGELAQKLTHPSYQIKKIYEVRLDKPVTKKDMDAIATGITLDDGEVHADSIAYTDAKDKSIVGIEIHSGRNRIVRRIFEHLGYDVKNLDRVMFANLTKKNVDRGKWRMLHEKEVRLLKFMNQSFVKKDTTKVAMEVSQVPKPKAERTTKPRISKPRTAPTRK